MTAIATQLRRRKETISVLDFTTRPGLLVRDEVDELRPASDTYRLSEMAVLHHPLDIQTFKGDQAVLVNKFPAQLVVKVKALVLDLFVGGRDTLGGFLNRLVAFIAIDPKVVGFLGFKFATQTTLADLQCTFNVAVELGCWNLIFVRQTNEVNQAQVNPDLAFNGCWFVLSLDCTKDRHEVFPALGFRDGRTSWRSLDCTMFNQLNPTYFGQVDRSVFDLETLRVANRLIVVLAVELWIAFRHSVFTGLLARFWQCSFSAHIKVAIKSFVQILQRLLQDLAVRLIQPVQIGVILFDRGQSVRTAFVPKRFLRRKVHVLAQIKRGVIDKARMAELNRQFCSLIFGWVDSELKRFKLGHYLEPFLRLRQLTEQGHRPCFCQLAQQEVSTSYAFPLGF